CLPYVALRNYRNSLYYTIIPFGIGSKNENILFFIVFISYVIIFELPNECHNIKVNKIYHHKLNFN
ncbi:hypothetical protein AB7180_20205, partial [Providencia rettgeri]